MNERLRYLALLCVALVACSTPEVLESRDGTVPPGLALSGDWQLRKLPPQERRRIADAINKTDGIDDKELWPAGA